MNDGFTLLDSMALPYLKHTAGTTNTQREKTAIRMIGKSDQVLCQSITLCGQAEFPIQLIEFVRNGFKALT